MRSTGSIAAGAMRRSGRNSCLPKKTVMVNEEELQHSADRVVRPGHSGEEKCSAENIENRGAHVRSNDPVHVVDAGIPPHPAVEFPGHEDYDSKDAVPGSEGYPRWHVPVHSHSSKLTAYEETDKESQVVREIDSD